ncbi:MAG: YMGG-like glycine zipper-containing protein [Geminicoccaceae bacterium]
MKTPIIGLALAVGLSWLSTTPSAQQLYIYPNQGQSPEQQQTDQGECHVWAVQETGFDPANPPPPPSGSAPTDSGPGVVGGAARGAALGAVAGAIGGNAGKGAAIGAATGGLFGGMKKSDSRNQAAQQQRQANAQYDAHMAQQRQGYNRALGACLAARGYTVN